MMIRNTLLLLVFALFTNIAFAEDSDTIRLGVLGSGTLAWELAAMKNEGLLDKTGFKLETVALANQQAGKIALQAGSVDMIISDWIWVSGMRAKGSDYSFYPYSTSAGGLIVPENSPIKTIADLDGKKLGIAGGELDKNWILLKTLAKKQGVDLDRSVEKAYGAPPLLNQQLLGGRIDALLTYWHFAARLEAKGYRQLMSGEEVIGALGITETVPTLGYVFKQSWATRHTAALDQFLQAARAAKDRLCESDQAWQQISSLIEADDSTTEKQIRSRYCRGRPSQWGESEKNAAGKIYQLLRQEGNSKLTGDATQLQPGTFWSEN